jgi:hypothetical protein
VFVGHHFAEEFVRLTTILVLLRLELLNFRLLFLFNYNCFHCHSLAYQCPFKIFESLWQVGYVFLLKPHHFSLIEQGLSIKECVLCEVGFNDAFEFLFQLVNFLLEILFFSTFIEATTRKLLQGVFYLYVSASLLDLVFCFCCQYWFLLARACHLVLKNIELKVRVGNVVGFYFYHR